MMNSFFRIEGPLYNFLTKVWSLLVLNLCILLGSIPIITIGVSITAAYSTCFKLHENNDTRIIQNFISGYKQNFKQAIGFSVIQTVVCLIILVDLNYYIFFDQSNFIYFFGVLLVALAFLISYQYLYGYIARFKDSAKSVLMNSMKLAIANIWISILLSFISCVLLFFMASSPIAFVFILYMSVFIGCSFLIFLKSFLVLSVFKKYETEK